ncbi:MAG TPA: hypothetical protein VFY39_12920 [Gammaproteobacteria bacterium]|nr:hypothetical protein [Gammaproteobacteria bacterium]
MCGIDAAPVFLVRAAGKDVLLVERFDRERTDEQNDGCASGMIYSREARNRTVSLQQVRPRASVDAAGPRTQEDSVMRVRHTASQTRHRGKSPRVRSSSGGMGD